VFEPQSLVYPIASLGQVMARGGAIAHNRLSLRERPSFGGAIGDKVRHYPRPSNASESRWIIASIADSLSRGKAVPSNMAFSRRSPSMDADTVVNG